MIRGAATTGAATLRSLAIWFLLAPFAAALHPTAAYAEFGDSSTPDAARRGRPNSTAGAPEVGTSLQTGDATYAIQIEVPPGLGGLSPEISLRYSSGNLTDSAVGYGWSLSIPSLQRSLRRGTPSYVDRSQDQVCDTGGASCPTGSCGVGFCLLADTFEFGGQPLVYLDSSGSVDEYATRQESFAIITHDRSTNSWTVDRKDGRRLIFGSSPAGRIGPDGTRVFEWLLEAEEDPVGNRIDYTYSVERGIAYPSEISYGLGTSKRVLRFELAASARQDQPVSYLAGFERGLMRRIDIIKVQIGSGANISGISGYQLEYAGLSPDSYRTLLRSVIRLPSNAVTQRTDFRYSSNVAEGTEGWQSTPITWTVNTGKTPALVNADNKDVGGRLADVNGDGLVDLYAARVSNSGVLNDSDNGVFLNTGTGFVETYPIPSWSDGTPVGFARTSDFRPTSAHAVDLTGDGRTDLAYGRRELANGAWATNGKSNWIHSTQGSGTGAPTYWEHRQAPSDQLLAFLARDGSWDAVGGAAFFTELNGDGLLDLFVDGWEGQGGCTVRLSSYYYQNLGNLTFAAGAREPITGGGACSPATILSVDYPLLYDVGFHNIQRGDTSRIGRSSGSASNFNFAEVGYWFGDRNNDGLDDYQGFLNRGAGTFAFGDDFSAFVWMPQFAQPLEYRCVQFVGGICVFLDLRDTGARWADINGDGKVDVVRAINTSENVYIGDGDVGGDFDQPDYPFVSVAAARWNPPAPFVQTSSDGISFERDTGARLADVDGDGMADFVQFNKGVSGTRHVWLNRGRVPDLLVEVESHLGGVTTIEYEPSTAAVFRETPVSIFPNSDANDIGYMPFVKQLVRSVTTDSGYGAVGRAEYIYHSGYFDPAEREFRGYAQVIETRGNVVGTSFSPVVRTVTEFHQDVALGGLPSRQARQGLGAQGAWLDWEVVTTSYVAPGATPPYWILPSCVVTSQYDGGTTPRRTGTTYSYDANGNPQVVDEFGLVTSESCADDPADELRIIVTTFAGDETSRVRNRPARRLLYSTAGGLAIVDSQVFYYDDSGTVGEISAGLLTTEVHTAGSGVSPTKTYAYNNAGLLTDSVNAREYSGELAALGGTTTVTYLSSFPDLVLSVTGPEVNGSRFTSTISYAAVSGICALGQQVGAGRPGRETDPNSVETVRCYDSLGRPTVELVREPSGASFVQLSRKTWTYVDTPGSASVTLSEDVDLSGGTRKTTTYLDGFGRVIRTTTDGPVSCGALCKVEVVDTYDGLGRKISETLPAFGQVSSFATTFTYDPLGRETSRTLPGPGPRAILTTRAPGRVDTTDAMGSVTRRLYDAFGRVQQVHQDFIGEGDVVSYIYDVADRLRQVNHDGAVTTIAYDALGRRTSLDDPDAGETLFLAYDANGNLLESDGPLASGDHAVWSYDPLNRPLSRSVGSVTWSYDSPTVPNSKGRMTQSTRAGRTHAVLAYDGLGRPRQEHFASSFVFDVESSYDQLGALATRTYPNGRIVIWQKDARGYPTGVVGQLGSAMETYASGVSWDPQGRLASWLGGDSTAMAFDDATGRLESVQIGGGGAIESLTYEYRADDLVLNIFDINDASRSRSFDYDGMKRLLTASGPFGPSRTSVSHCYRYDGLGNLTQKDGAPSGASCTGGQAFTYPAPSADRPHGADTAGGVAVGYDLAGNTSSLLGRSYTYDGVGGLLTVKSGSTTLGSFQYDADDRLSRAAGGGETKYRPTDDFDWWQTAQLARAYVTLGGQVIAVRSESYAAPSTGGGGGGCASMPVPAGLPPESGLPLLLLYGLAAVAVAHVGLRLPRRRRAAALVALGTGGAFLVVFLVPPGLTPAQAQSAAGITYYHQDHLGSTVIVTGGPTATRAVYAPFGQLVAETAGGSTAAPDVGFTGQRFEAAVGIYDYGARWYHPDLGHFLTPDALVPDAYDSQLLNRYAYVRNNPINKIDPTGNTPIGYGDAWDDYNSSDPWGVGYDPFGGFDPFQAFAGLGFVMTPPPPPPPPPDPFEKLLAEMYPDLRSGWGAGGSQGRQTVVTYGYTDTPVNVGNHVVVIGADLQTGEAYATRAGPAQGRGGAGCCTIFAESGVFDESFRDPPSAVHTRQFAGTLDMPLEAFAPRAQEFERTKNSNRIPYLGATSNSNSYGFTFGESLGLGRPRPAVSAPGWRFDIRPPGPEARP